MSQEYEETRGGTAPTSDGRGGLDPWAALSPAEEFVVAAAAPAIASTPIAPARGDDAQREYDESLPAPDHRAGLAADANAAAVAAALAERSAEPAPSRGGAFTIPLLCAGVAVIAACLLIPQSDANRRLAYERTKLQADLQAVERQVEVNDEFLRKVSDDPNLAERLAQRQMKIIREGNAVLNLRSDGEDEMSPFQLTAVPAPADLPPYHPRGGLLAGLCRNPKSRLHLMGIGLLAIAAGLVLGFGPPSSFEPRSDGSAG